METTYIPKLHIDMNDMPLLSNNPIWGDTTGMMTYSYDIRFAAQRYGVSGCEIVEAVEAVGTLFSDIEKYLGFNQG